jgi:hypothetical protein
MERPKVKPNVRWLATERGLLVTHGDDGLLLPNPKVAAIADKLVGEIDGRRTVRELEASLPAKAQPLMAAILSHMTDKGMLVEAPRGLVAAEVVESDTGMLALTIGGDWEERLHTWLEIGISVSGPDAWEVDNIARQVEEAGGHVANRARADRIEICTTERLAVVAVETSAGTVIGAASPEFEAAWLGPHIPLSQGEVKGKCRHDLWRRNIVLATIVRYVLLSVIAPHIVAGKIILVDDRGLTNEFNLERDNALGIASVERSDPLADTAEWLNEASPFAAAVDVEPAFPLAHRAIKLKGNGDAPDQMFIEWGLTPQEADERALAVALAGLSAKDGINYRQEDEIEKQGDCEAQNVVADDLSSKAAVLWRVSELYTGGAPSVQVIQRDKKWMATATLGKIRGNGSGVDRGEAIATAIGNALSTAQIGRAPTGHVSAARDAL